MEEGYALLSFKAGINKPSALQETQLWSPNRGCLLGGTTCWHTSISHAEGTCYDLGKALALAACPVPQGLIPITHVGYSLEQTQVAMSTQGPERNKTLRIQVGRYLLEL